MQREKHNIKDIIINENENDEDYSDASRTFISDSQNDDSDKTKLDSDFLKDDLTLTNANLFEKYQSLQKKMKKKEEIISKFRETIKTDDKLKSNLKGKIDQLKENLKNLKDTMNNIDNFNEDEINDLLDNLENKDESEETDMISSPINYYNMNINANNQNMIGNAMVNDYQTRVYLANSKTCWGKIIIFRDSIVEWLTPFKSEMSVINARYDKNVSGLFEFSRFLFIFNILVSLTAFYLLINHFLIYNSNNYSDSTLCVNFLPCSILYSRFSYDEKKTYSFTFMGICVVIFFILISKWTEYKRHDLLMSLFDSENIAFSKIVFNPWLWHTDSEDKKEDACIRLKNIFTIGTLEREIKEKIKDRTKKRKFFLYTLRFISILLSIVILAIDAICVAGLYIAQAYLFYRDTDKSSISALDLIAIAIPPVGLIVINTVVPKLLYLCVQLENWDFNSTKIAQLLWRVYTAKLFTLMIVYILIILFTILEKSAESVFQSNDFDVQLKLSCFSYNNTVVNDSSLLSSSTIKPYTSYANCKEDDAAIRFLLNLITDFLVRKITPPVMLFIRYLICFKCRGLKRYKDNYDVIGSITSHLLFNIQIYLLIPFFPYILFLSPILLYIDFKYEYFNIKVFFDKPMNLTLQEKTGYVIMTLFTFTMLIIIFVFILYFVNPLEHFGFMQCFQQSSGKILQFYNITLNCGPYPNNESPKSVMYESIINTPVVLTVYEFLANPLYLLLVALLLVIILIYSCKVSDAFEFYIKEKKKESKNTESALNEIIKKMRDQIKVLKTGLQNVK